MAGCCGGNAEAVQQAQDIINERGVAFNAMNAPRGIGSDVPRMVYRGPRDAPVTYFGKYEGWRGMDAIPVSPGDVERLQANRWELVEDFPHVPQPAAIYPDGAAPADPAGMPTTEPDEIKDATPEQVYAWRMANGWLTEAEAEAQGTTQLQARIDAGNKQHDTA